MLLPSRLIPWRVPVLTVIMVVLGLGDAAAQKLPLREAPDDPPGVAARPTPGPRFTADVTFGSYTHTQVNVDFIFKNIMGDAANEPSLAVDPTNPSHMAIGWRQFDTIASNFREGGYAYSRDGGRRWTFVGVLEDGVFRSDPVLSFDAGGTFYYNSLKVVGDIFNTDVWVSNDAGMTWAGPNFAFGGDKTWMVVDRSGGIGDGFMYQWWSTAANQYGTNTFNRSSDGGLTWSTPSGVPLTPIWGVPDVGANGALYLCGANPNNFSNFIFSRSSNAQDATVTPPTFDLTTFVDLGGSIRFQSGPNPAGLLGQVNTVVDKSNGANAGNIYVVCSVDPPGIDPLDVYFIRSVNGGTSWSTPLRLNTDAEASNNWQWFATMSVAPNGRIDVVWNDTRGGPSTPLLSKLYYTSSGDGGTSWTSDEQISPVFNSYDGFPQQNKIGDYYHLISDLTGAGLAWAATFNGEQDVYYTRIGPYDCNQNGVADSTDIANMTSPDVNMNGIPDECEDVVTSVASSVTSSYRLHQNHPNPFNPTTTIAFDMPEQGGHVSVRVYDAAGALIRTLVDGFEPGGARDVIWDGRDDQGSRVATGIYFYRLQSGTFSQTKKMVLLK